MKRLTLLVGMLILLTGCSNPSSNLKHENDRLVRQQRCRAIGLDMRLTDSADASSGITATSVARANRDYERYQCSDFDKDCEYVDIL